MDQHVFRSACVGAVTLGALVLGGPVQAQTPLQDALGKLMATVVIAQKCQVDVSAQQKAAVDAAGERLQAKAGLTSDQLKEVYDAIDDTISEDMCPAIKPQRATMATEAVAEAGKVQ